MSSALTCKKCRTKYFFFLIALLEKLARNSKPNIFKTRTVKKKKKKWNSILTNSKVSCKFHQNWLKKVAMGINGLKSSETKNVKIFVFKN
jgi:hypothetical protein